MKGIFTLKRCLTTLFILLVVVAGSYPFISQPIVLGSTVGDEVRTLPFNAPFKIVFSQMMHGSSVEEALTIQKYVDGAFIDVEMPGTTSWKQNAFFYFPQQTLEVGERYRLTISNDAKNIWQKNLSEVYSVMYEIIDAPQVVFHSPNDSSAVTTDVAVTLMFDQPIIAVGEKEVAPKLTITPDVQGSFEWIGTSTVQFVPKKLAAATQYSVTLPAGTKTVNGGETTEDYAFTFSTVRPEIVRLFSLQEQRELTALGPKDALIIEFNQAIQKSSLTHALSIMQEKRSISFNVRDLTKREWEKMTKDMIEPASKNHFVAVVINETVPPATLLDLTIDINLRGTEGPLTLEKQFSQSFLTADLPEVLLLGSDFPRLSLNNGVKASDLSKYLRITPKPKQALTQYETDDIIYDYYIGNIFEPEKTYRIEIAKEIRDVYGQTLSKDASFDYTAPPLRSFLEIRTRDFANLMDANQPPEFYLKTAQVDEVTISVAKVDVQDFVSMQRSYSYSYVPAERQSFTKKLNTPSNAYAYTKIDLNEGLGTILEPGLYYVTASSPTVNYPTSKIFVLGKSALNIKQSDRDGSALVWATNLEDGKPIADMDIAFYVFENDRTELVQATTNKEGIARLKLTDRKRPYLRYVAVGSKNGDITVAEHHWSSGINPWNFDITSSTDQDYYAYVYTERPIYRPEDTVYYKGIVRGYDALKFNMLSNADMFVSVYDANDAIIVKSEKRPLSEHGTFNGKLTLPPSSSLGEYEIVASIVERDTNEHKHTFRKNFSVAEYRKPDYRITLSPDADAYTHGDKVNVAVDAEYFFGGAVKNARLSTNITRTDYFFNEYDGAYYSFGENNRICFYFCPEGESELVTQQEGRLNEAGHATVTFNGNIPKDKPSQFYTVETTITEKNGRSVSSRTIVPVHKGEYYIGINSNDYVYTPREKIEANIISVDYSGKPLANKKAYVHLMQREWKVIKKEGVDGDFYYENEIKDTPVTKTSVTTGADGKATAVFSEKLAGGSYVLLAESTDGKGNTVRSATEIYVVATDFINWGRDNNDRIELVTDKREYKPGETARVLVKSPFANVKALVTVERSTILDAFITDIPTNSHVIEIPIKESYLPNAYVSVMLMKGGGSSRSVTLKLAKHDAHAQDIAQKISEIEAQLKNGNTSQESLLAPFKKKRDEMKKERKALIAARDAQKNTSNNDDGIPSFKLGYTQLLVNTAEKKLQVSLAVNKKTYLPGETVTLKIDTKDSNGKAIDAEVSVAVVDESVLALKKNVVFDLLNYFYTNRGLGITTVSSLTQFLNRVNVLVESGMKGGGGGLAKKVRKNFKDTAHWSAVVKTQKGIATVQFTLPDNLTTWRVTGVAVTKDTKVGAGMTDFLVQKNVLMRPLTPRFFTVGDRLQTGFTAHNFTDQTLDLTAKLTTDDLIVGTPEKTLTLRGGEEKSILWDVQVKPVTQASLSFDVRSDDDTYRDTVALKLPIHPYSYPQLSLVSKALPTDEVSALETVRRPAGSDPVLGSLHVNLSATLANGIKDGLERLEQYPYGCAEQTASSLLPNLVVKQVLDAGGSSHPFINLKNLRERVTDGLQRLYDYQQPDGGFGLWHTSQANVHLSSYILYTLYEAKQAGYTVDADVMRRAERYVVDNLSATPDANERAFAVYVLSEIGNRPVGYANNLYQFKKDLTLTGKTYLALAMQKLRLSKATTLINEIVNTKDMTGRGVQFVEKTPRYALYDSDTKLTALVLKLLVRHDKEHPLIDGILRHLLHEQQIARWHNTHSAVHALLGIIEHVTSVKEFSSEFFAKVILNGDNLDSAAFKKDNILQVKEVEFPMSKVQPENEVVISRSGTGRLYYDILLKYYLPLERLVHTEKGYSIEQEYYAIDDTEFTKPLSSLPFGETVASRVKIVVPEDRYYTVIEDMLPAGTEGVDFSLETAQQSLFKRQTQPAEYDPWWGGRLSYFNHSEVRDDRVLYFADYLPKGVYEVVYFVRATSKGLFADLPTKAQEMYLPEVMAHTRGRYIEIR